MKRFLMLVCTAALMLSVTAGVAAAQPNHNASCVAQYGHVLGNVGQYQRDAHDPTVGQRIVKLIALHDDCDNPPPG
jgi:hypothetical protein